MLLLTFQSPSLRGSGRFRPDAPDAPDAPDGFNPLHCGAVVASKLQRSLQNLLARFNPLHCGAVVASTRKERTTWRTRWTFQSPSLRGSGRFSLPPRLRPRPFRFNPLHCGAVVASLSEVPPFKVRFQVSIPFIAGQWSLPDVAVITVFTPRMFQSPSLRGSGRFSQRSWVRSQTGSCFNPLHCGAVVASRGDV